MDFELGREWGVGMGKRRKYNNGGSYDRITYAHLLHFGPEIRGEKSLLKILRSLPQVSGVIL